MKKYIYIGVGGTLGAILRYVIENIHASGYKGNIPLNTLIINIIGSFILALVFTVSYEIFKLNELTKLGITSGFLGAFTTFSTMCKETFKLIDNGHFFMGIFYILLSVGLGLGAAYLGSIAAKNVGYKFAYKKDEIYEAASDYSVEEGDE